MRDVDAELTAWLKAFSACVRARDISGGRALFHPDCSAFGTRNAALDGLDDLVDRQWRPTWNETLGFDFDSGSINTFASSDLSHGCVIALWTSGVDADQPAAVRSGRATFVLIHEARWVCVHSHLSYNPSGLL